MDLFFLKVSTTGVKLQASTSNLTFSEAMIYYYTAHYWPQIVEAFASILSSIKDNAFIGLLLFYFDIIINNR